MPTCVHLHSIKVQVRAVGAGGNAGRGAAAHADAVRGPPDLDNEHAQLRVVLVQVLVVYLAEAPTAGKAETLPLSIPAAGNTKRRYTTRLGVQMLAVSSAQVPSARKKTVLPIPAGDTRWRRHNTTQNFHTSRACCALPATQHVLSAGVVGQSKLYLQDTSALITTSLQLLLACEFSCYKTETMDDARTGGVGREALLCLRLTHLNMMGLIHSRRSPEGMRRPNVRV